MDMVQNEANLRTELCESGIRLLDAGLVAKTWGNVSCRLQDNSFLITPSGRNYRDLTPQEMVKVSLHDQSYEGSIRPSSESGLHRSVYKEFPEIGAVIHTHQPFASAISATALEALPFPRTIGDVENRIFITEYTPSGTDQMAAASVSAMKKSNTRAALLRRHGVISAGTDLSEAFSLAFQMEKISDSLIEETFLKIEGEQVFGISSLISPEALRLPELSSGTVLQNRSRLVVRFSNIGVDLPPMLDDFAQIAGIGAVSKSNDPTSILKAFMKSPVVLLKSHGALCYGTDEDDALAISMVVEKNILAYYAAVLMGKILPLDQTEAQRLRSEYLHFYSKLDERNK